MFAASLAFVCYFAGMVSAVGGESNGERHTSSPCVSLFRACFRYQVGRSSGPYTAQACGYYTPATVSEIAVSLSVLNALQQCLELVE